MRGLLLIDIQQAFADPVWGSRNNPEAEQMAGALLTRFRAASAPVFHVRHLSTNPESPLHPARGQIGYHPAVAPAPGEPSFDKSVNSAFIGTGLEAALREAGVTEVVICGLTTPHCVSTSTRMAANLGFTVTLVEDACAAFDSNADTRWRPGPAPSAQDIHIAALDHLNGEFARVLAAADLGA
ncbi:MAG: cysteine hydrolase [Rhodobacterales bacterium]|nr:MAG: cysteine hydrolase [Rhodobacterales bacterium]